MSVPTLITTTMKTARIIVIGAGPSGIAAATRLLEAGFTNVVILEAENRIGGRIYTVPFADNVVDLGAQWCHGEKNNVIYEMVQNLNMLERTEDYYNDYKCVRSNGEVVDSDLADKLKRIAFNSIPERQTELVGYEGSLGAYITEKYWQEVEKLKIPVNQINVVKEFLENFKQFECSVEASDTLFEVSGKGHLEYWLCEGELLLNWKNKGFVSFLQLLMKSKATDDLGILKNRVLFNKRVERIQWQHKENIKLTCWSGEIIEADHVICTVSLGVLKENHQKMFEPALPVEKLRAIQGLKLGTVNKFFMEFAEAFAPLDWGGINFLWCQEDLKELRASKLFWLESVFGFYRVSYQPRLLEGWIIGPHGRYMETLSVSEVQDGIMWLFRKFLKFPVPDPINFMRTQWYANPNFRGSYTFRSIYTDELRTGAWDLAAPLSDNLGKPLVQFAGESTHAHYYSTVHGAVESGWREAQRLISYYDSRPSQL